MGRFSFILLFAIVLLSNYGNASPTPSAETSLFFPEEEYFTIPHNLKFNTEIHLKDASGNDIFIDEDDEIYQNITCISDVPPPECRRCALFHPDYLEKTVDSAGIIHCSYMGSLPDNNKTTIEVKYGDILLKKYVIGEDPSILDPDHSGISLSIGEKYAGQSILTTYNAKNGNNKYLSAKDAQYWANRIHIEHNLQYANFSSVIEGSIRYDIELPTTKGNYYFRLYYCDEEDKVYLADETVVVRPHFWKPSESTITTSPYFYVSPSGINNFIKFDPPRDIYGNVIEEMVSPVKVKIFEHTANRLLYEGNWVYPDSNKNIWITGNHVARHALSPLGRIDIISHVYPNDISQLYVMLT